MPAVGHPVWISALGTAEPGPALPQAAIVDWLAERLQPGTTPRRLRHLAAHCGVESRHSAIGLAGPVVERLYPTGGGAGDGMGVRCALHDRLAPDLAMAAVRAAVPDGGGRITHLVTATCTGAAAPGLELRLVQRLGLPGTVRRLGVNLLGCYAAIPALRAAWHICAADPAARVLVVCCELCSLHLRAGPEDDALLAALLFGDGAAAAIVEAAPAPVGLGLRIAGDASAIAPDSDAAMTWMAHPDAFRLHLAPDLVPRLGEALPGLAQELLGGAAAATARWCVHPGGPRILDAAAAALGLDDAALAWPRRELARAGNRSSPTVLAILRAMLAEDWRGPAALLGFGPGLTADALLVERHDSARSDSHGETQ